MEILKIADAGFDGGFRIINKIDMQPDDVEYGLEVAGESTMTSAQIKDKLTAANIEFKSNASKAELLALINSVPQD